ncbi:MAG: acylneuraminate cytidylyltransferase family protein [Thermoplasmatales archaeon]|nr:acylneuraminate cytidylyltransferase family protein [Thermoplasmatales archaeon]
MKVVAFIPIKLNSQRLPNKNILPVGDKPLCRHIMDTLLACKNIDELFVYCSDVSIKKYMPSRGITFLKRDSRLDGNKVKGMEIYSEFVKEIDADIYVLVHTTSPFVTQQSIDSAIDLVKSGKYDSAFSVQELKTFVWYKGHPLNYNLTDIPRTQDIEPVFVETSGFYIFTKEVIRDRRRIGDNPYPCVVTSMEAIDIDDEDDYVLACLHSKMDV